MKTYIVRRQSRDGRRLRALWDVYCGLDYATSYRSYRAARDAHPNARRAAAPPLHGEDSGLDDSGDDYGSNGPQES